MIARAAKNAKEQTEDGARRELARGTLELAILSVLAAAPRYGYELMSLLKRSTDGALELKEGTLYPVLHRLEDGGLVTTFWEAEGRAPSPASTTRSPQRAGRARRSCAPSGTGSSTA